MSVGINFVNVPAPTAGVDGRVALATSLHAAPGVYAVLVGSGMSSAAGVPTGWQVVEDLIRTIAVAEGVDRDVVEADPEAWWTGQGRPEPRYDTILPSLASTDAARQVLLRRYFDPPVQPTAGHHALAALCAAGRIRVIVTTNFDRLIERALDQVGITPQVITSPTSVAGMTPLTHAEVTVVKLHGDYATPGLRNSPDELMTYPPEWDSLLDRIFDEFGLVVVGWSADYDVALAAALSRSLSHRYPVFWTSHEGRLSEAARRLIGNRGATVIDTTSADEFLGDLVERVRRLDEVAARRGRPSALRSYSFPPEQTTPQGWAVLPLLQLTAVGAVGPATTDTVGMIRPQQREALINALRVDPFSALLRGIATIPAAVASVEGSATESAPPLTDWVATPGSHQSMDYASYRLGGDASRGVSALVTVRLPGFGIVGSVVFKVDMAISTNRMLRLGEAARLLRDALVVVTAVLPEVLSDVVPSDANVQQGEVHILAAATDGNGKNRPNDLLERLDMTPLGEPTRTLGSTLGFAARLTGPLASHEAAEVVAEAFDFMALAIGYLDPRVGIMQLRSELGLPPAT